METISEHRCFEGVQGFYRHDSNEIGLPMQFSVYQPPQAVEGKVPVLFYLAGLTCNEETFMFKAGAQRFAAQHGVMLVAPDTSPRNTGIEGEGEDWEIGAGAGFYVDATEAPWSKHFRMESYIVNELRDTIASRFPAQPGPIGIFGHSMGGHGALVLALRHPEVFGSVSALAPICAPSRCPWGQKAFGKYLGPDLEVWRQHDATELMKKSEKQSEKQTEQQSQAPFPNGILIDQGMSDKFLDTQLFPHRFEVACRAAGQPLTLRRHVGYDHGYHFISTFIDDHIAFHGAALGGHG